MTNLNQSGTKIIKIQLFISLFKVQLEKKNIFQEELKKLDHRLFIHLKKISIFIFQQIP